ncbi:hypothetical protein NDU88_007300 [Pleurodeles waltl]|uniref:Uncharacterized protein n=1 Tax=Pleurodeles waltl TaxID=8319 RepID=A0AAV7MFR8_PLEWA|nr:hypothetical protein NDU88_007300 [Pleurodeles waltl]
MVDQGRPGALERQRMPGKWTASWLALTGEPRAAENLEEQIGGTRKTREPVPTPLGDEVEVGGAKARQSRGRGVDLRTGQRIGGLAQKVALETELTPTDRLVENS